MRHTEGTTPIETGDAFLFKPGEPHQLINTSDQDMVIYVIAVPGQFPGRPPGKNIR